MTWDERRQIKEPDFAEIPKDKMRGDANFNKNPQHQNSTASSS